MSDEFGRIQELRRRFCCPSSDVVLGIGDDAALLSPCTAALVVSVDAHVEGVHFRREWASLRQIGRRAVVAALSDLAAMAAMPRAALVAMTLPLGLQDAELYELADGIGDAARAHRCPIVGGNLSRASDLSLTTTVCGRCTGKPLTRQGARAGDGIWVTGQLGAAALGLAALTAGETGERARPFVQRWREPMARLEEGQQLGGVGRAGIDLSDGLLQDLRHVCRASGLGAVLHADRLPLAAGHERLSRELGLNGLEVALGGGEDYELLAALPPHARPPQWATRIGEFTDQLGIVDVLTPDGRPLARPEREGYRHET
ncbi:MAG: thiamine-phosphate kinase [Proteobacteria bacterium]|nr:thiamine-phosphate kinase [Pseudomonadota bacterium]